MKHPTVESVGIQNPVDKSDKAWIIKGYEPWEHYRSVNLPLFESQVDGMFADCLMTGSSAIASQPLNDSSAKRFNELPSYELRDQPLSQYLNALRALAGDTTPAAPPVSWSVIGPALAWVGAAFVLFTWMHARVARRP